MKKFIISLLAALLFATGFGVLFGAPIGVASFAVSLISRDFPKDVALMALNVEIWQNDIVGNLFKNNEFLLNSIDESQYVLAGSVVHIPQAGAPSKAERNRKNLPATITNRKDVDVTYALDEITTDPRIVYEADKAELSYDKRQSVIQEDMAAIEQIAADAMLYRWAPTYYIQTSGSTAYTAHYGTGNRKGVTWDDFKKAKKIFNKWNVPKADRYVILDSEMISQLQAELKANTSRSSVAGYNDQTGELTALEGFKIYERGTVLLASAQTLTAVSGTDYLGWTGGTSKLYTIEQFGAIEAGEAAAATTSAAVALFWSKTMVSRALGTTKMFENVDDATYYGSIVSFLQRIGGRARRGDGKGVLGLIQVTV